MSHCRTICAGVLTAALLAFSGAASAALITVNNLNDAGPGSLRQAILDAGAGDTIDFGVTGVIALTSGELLIDKTLEIAGPGQSALLVDGSANSRIFQVTNGSVLISDLTVTNGVATEGGGIRADADLTLVRVHVSANSVSVGGGGIANFGVMRIIGSTVLRNLAPNGTGAGIANDSEATLAVVASTISLNSAGVGSGGIFNSGNLTVENSTISGNTASNNAGGIYAGGSTSLLHTTITDNWSPAGAGMWALGQVSLEASIIADNLGGGDCGGQPPTSLGYNLAGDLSCALTHATDLPGTPPSLGPLAPNGGPTQTHALLAGSPAIDQIPTCTTSTDQRGVARPQGALCDIGAYEVVQGSGSCTMDLAAAVDDTGALKLDFLLGAGQPTSWTTFLFVENSAVPLWTISLPTILSPVQIPISFGIPDLGQIGILSYLYTSTGIQCFDFELVNTSP